HLTASLKEARAVLKGKSGIYCIKCTQTGSMYIGSAIDLYTRIYMHVMGHASNLHLQNAIQLYDLASFAFYVVEFCDPSELLSLLLHCCIAALLHCCIAALLHCCIAALLHCCIAALLHCRPPEGLEQIYLD